MTISEKEILYFEAKDKYYEGNPIMSDEEFDALENELDQLGSDVTRVVGQLDTTKLKHSHPSKMLSLDKVKTDHEGNPPTEKFLKWLKKTGINEIEFTQKLDGSSANLIYRYGQFHKAITRGDGFKGQDITEKLRLLSPATIKDTTSAMVEIRGEVVIEKKLFEKKYSMDFENERNFVAGKLGDEKADLEICKDLTFIPFDVKMHTNSGIELIEQDVEKYFIENNFQFIPLFKYVKFGDNEEENKNIFIQIFEAYKNYRENECPYRLDGFVAKTTSNRIYLGENSHHPHWALAIKFQPKLTTTKLVGIEWSLGKTGEFTPIAHLEPVELDGTIVKKCSLHNWSYIQKNNIKPETIVEIFKAGDIIPQIKNVLESKENIPEFDPLTTCPHCGADTVIDEIRIICPNEKCSGTLFYKFQDSVSVLNLDFFGEETLRKIYQAGFDEVFLLFDKSIFNGENLIAKGVFPDGKTVDKILYQIGKIRNLELYQIILMMGISSLGTKIAKEIAKMVAGIEYSDFGMTKKFFEMFKADGEKIDELNILIEKYKEYNIEVFYPEDEAKYALLDVWNFEMTGNTPKDLFKTKADFVKWVAPFGFTHTTLNANTKYLICDDKNSKTSKMKKAEKLGVIIKTYEEIYYELA